jgi:hypothetical protein
MHTVPVLPEVQIHDLRVRYGHKSRKFSATWLEYILDKGTLETEMSGLNWAFRDEAKFLEGQRRPMIFTLVKVNKDAREQFKLMKSGGFEMNMLWPLVLMCL